MERISINQVELTGVERYAYMRFEAMLTKGYSIHRARRRTEELFPGLDSEFYEWLAAPDGEMSTWHEETWNYACDTLREAMQDAGFEVHINAAAGTLTVIERSTNQALGITPTSNTHAGEITGVEALSKRHA